MAESSRPEQEKTLNWCNRMLEAGGHGDQVVTDLGADLADGTLLIKILQVAVGVSVGHYYATPIMKSQKLQNLQLCLNAMYDHGIPVTGLRADALYNGDTRSVLSMCKSLQTYHKCHGEGEGPQNSKTASTGGDAEEDRHGIVGSDKSFLKWVESVIKQDVDSYAALGDGKLLCSLVNTIHPGAISAMELGESSAPVDRLRLVDSALKEYLFISVTFDPDVVAGGGQERQVKHVLHQCQKVWEQKTQRRAMAARTRRLKSSSSDREHSRELYLQGASSATDLSSHRTRHQEMVHRGIAGLKKHSSSEGLGSRKVDSYGSSQTSFEASQTGFETSQTGFEASQPDVVLVGSLERVRSMESGIAYQHHASWLSQQGGSGERTAMARASSHSSLQHTFRPFSSSTNNLRSSQQSLLPRRHVGSVARLDSGDEWNQQMLLLEEKVSLLARQLLHERRDMFKQMMRKLIEERRKRRLAEKRLVALDKKSRDLVCHYDNCFIVLAKEVKELQRDVSELKGQGGVGGVSTQLGQEIQLLQQKVEAVSGDAGRGKGQVNLDMKPHLPSLASHQPNHHSKTVFFRMRNGMSNSRDELLTSLRTSYSAGRVASYQKLKKFFGEDPPRVETMESFLDSLGEEYFSLLPLFHDNQIGLGELSCLTEAQLKSLGLSLGQRAKIMSELKTLIACQS